MTPTEPKDVQEITDADVADVGAELATTDEALLAEFLAVVEADEAEADSSDATMAIIARTLRASTVEEILRNDQAVSSDDYVGKPFVMREVRFSRSTFEGDGPQFFAIAQCVNQDGEPFVLTTGAARVLSQAFKLRKAKALPISLVICKAERKSRNGYFPLWLEAGPQDF